MVTHVSLSFILESWFSRSMEHFFLSCLVWFWSEITELTGTGRKPRGCSMSPPDHRRADPVKERVQKITLGKAIKETGESPRIKGESVHWGTPVGFSPLEVLEPPSILNCRPRVPSSFPLGWGTRKVQPVRSVSGVRLTATNLLLEVNRHTETHFKDGNTHTFTPSLLVKTSSLSKGA